MENEVEVINGLGAAEFQEFISGLDAAQLRKLVSQQKRLAKAPVGITKGSSRDEFIKKLSLLDPQLQGELKNGSKRLADVELYVVKSVSGGVQSKILTDDDTKVIGIGNFSRAMLEKGNVLMLDTIILLGGANSSLTDPGDVSFGIIESKVRNGEFTFEANGTQVVPITALEAFNTTNLNQRIGSFRLDNPVLVHSQVAMKFQADWKTPATANYWLKLILKGTMLYKK